KRTWVVPSHRWPSAGTSNNSTPRQWPKPRNPMNTTDFLWKAQLEHWPKSIRLTPQEVIQWATKEPQRRRPIQLLITIQYEHGVFYRIPYTDHRGEPQEYRGFRFGPEGHEYLSFY